MNFLVLDFVTGTFQEFDTPESVAFYLWGRNLNDYKVYLGNNYVQFPTAEVKAIEERLKIVGQIIPE